MTYVTDQMREAMANHVLELVCQTDKITAYYLKEPGTRMGSTMLIFTPEGIAIMGDRVPTNNGTVSVFGVDLRWFAGGLSEDYLCEKFLQETWILEKAVEELRDPEGYWRDGQNKGTLRQLSRIATLLGSGEHGEEWLCDELSDLDMDLSEGVPGWDHYEPDQAGWLCAIQQRFAELYAEREATPAAESEADDGQPMVIRVTHRLLIYAAALIGVDVLEAAQQPGGEK